MGFQVPTFNLSCDVWRSGAGPPGPPAVSSVCQLRAAGKQSTGQDSSDVGWPFLWALLVPSGTDVRDRFSSTGPDIVEVPTGSGRFYLADYVDDVAKGFANEYRIAFIRKTGTWPAPIP